MYTEIKIEMSSQVSFHAKRNQSFYFILGLNNDVLIAEQKKQKTWLIHYTFGDRNWGLLLTLRGWQVVKSTYLICGSLSVCLKSRICLQELTSQF